MIDGLILSPLKIIDVEGGNVLHAMKKTDEGYDGFGEVYFSAIEAGRIKGWKRHHRMVLNLVVPTGAVRFVVYDDRADSSSQGVYSDVILSQQNYCRLTVPSGVWMSFQGISNDPSLVMNVSNIMHDPTEVDRKGLDEIDFNWSTK